MMAVEKRGNGVAIGNRQLEVVVSGMLPNAEVSDTTEDEQNYRSWNQFKIQHLKFKISKSLC